MSVPDGIQITARVAGPHDLAEILDLYRLLEAEMTALHPQWPRRDGLVEPVADTLAAVLDNPDAILCVGEIDGVVLGFLLAVVEHSLPQADSEEVGSIRFLFTSPDAREVGVAEEMRDLAMAWMRSRGITKFDAHVLPGHRLAKNFFEAGGFSARSIIMHRDDHPISRPGRDPRAR